MRKMLILSSLAVSVAGVLSSAAFASSGIDPCMVNSSYCMVAPTYCDTNCINMVGPAMAPFVNMQMGQFGRYPSAYGDPRLAMAQSLSWQGSQRIGPAWDPSWTTPVGLSAVNANMQAYYLGL